MRLKALPLSVRSTPARGTSHAASGRWRNWLATIPIILLGPALVLPYVSAGAAGATLHETGAVFPSAAILLTGKGFPARQSLQIRWDGSAEGMPNLRASNSGGVAVVVVVPGSAQPGSQHTISATRVSDSSARRAGAEAQPLASLDLAVQSSPPLAATDTPRPFSAEPSASTSSDGSSITTTGVPDPTAATDPTSQPDPTAATDPTSQPDPTAAPISTPTPTRPPTPRPTPTPTPRPTATQSIAGVSGVYGTAIGGDTLANTQIGGTDSGPATKVAYRFRADRSSALSAIRVYFEIGSGYSGGTGGTRRVSIETDSGGRPSGQALAATTVAGLQQFVTVSFPSSASLSAGQTYYVVFTNVDPSPGTNFVSANALYSWDRPSPAQPALGSGWAVLYAPNGGTWTVRGGYTPILELRYASGNDGVGYMEAWQRSQKPIGGSAAVRETFRVSGPNRTISSAAVRLQLASGSGALSVALEDGGGKVIASGAIGAGSFPAGSSCDCSSNRNGWGTTSLGSLTLVSGQTYRLVLTAASGTTYRAEPLRQGSAYGFSAASFFGDGQMEFTSGGSWQAVQAPWGGSGGEGDLQFYLK